jgi:hypothetical protein
MPVPFPEEMPFTAWLITTSNIIEITTSWSANLHYMLKVAYLARQYKIKVSCCSQGACRELHSEPDESDPQLDTQLLSSISILSCHLRVEFTPLPLYSRGKSRWYPLNRRLGGPHAVETTKLLPPAENRTLSRKYSDSGRDGESSILAHITGHPESYRLCLYKRM